MTMQTSGPISIGQAMEECQLAIPQQYDAGSTVLSKLAQGRTPGETIAWSYWYGQTFAQPINENFAIVNVVVDRYVYITVDFRTGAWSDTVVSTSNGARLVSYSQLAPAVPYIAEYSAWSCDLVYQSGTPGRTSFYATQQPSPSNDYTGVVVFDDNSASGAVQQQAYITLTCTL